ncbi:hypothetical protein ACFOY8_12110 [Thalassospira xianhensis]|nr:hypothetical protein [Thalassospira xianhensis]
MPKFKLPPLPGGGKRANPPQLEQTPAPCSLQTPAYREEHLRALLPGDQVVIRTTQGGMLGYTLANVEWVNTKNGRFGVDKTGLLASGGNSFYMKSGKNTFAPTGQTRAFALTDELRKFISEYGENPLSPSISLKYKVRFD